MPTSPGRSLPRLRARLILLACLAALPMFIALAGCDAEQKMNGMIEKLMPPSPSEVARQVWNVYDPDARRRSIATLSAAKFGGEPPYVRLDEIMIDDEDATVRAAAIKALGEHGTVDDAKKIYPKLRDDASFVRWEAAKALQRIHNPVVIQPLIEACKDDDGDVREACADALGQYPEPPVVSVLVGLLDDQDFAVVNAAGASLATLTGQDLGTDGTAWLSWVEANRTDMFKDQQRFTYMPYVQPRGFWARMKFWKKVKKVEPQSPTGIEADATPATTGPATRPAL